MVKKQINVVNLSDVKENDGDIMEEKNDDEQLNQIKEEIRKEESTTPVVQTEVKTKPKRKPKTTKAQEPEVKPDIEPKKSESDNEFFVEESSEPSLNAIERKVEPPKEEQSLNQEPPPKEEQPKKVKTVELVKCEKCGKEMTKRTLRYDHEKTCPGKPIIREAVPVKRRTVIDKKEQDSADIPEDVIESEVKKRIQNMAQERLNTRIKAKEERIKKLSAHIA